MGGFLTVVGEDKKLSKATPPSYGPGILVELIIFSRARSILVSISTPSPSGGCSVYSII
jgi:hypothetical protein